VEAGGAAERRAAETSRLKPRGGAPL
jgi:hypothetical protein